MGEDSRHEEWDEFDAPAGQIAAILKKLPEDFKANQARARFAELCYWFNEAVVEFLEGPNGD